MKYDEKKFNSAVEEYKKSLGNVKAKSFFVVFDIKNKPAFYSIAPLSRALHELGADVSCIGIKSKSEGLEALKDVWKTFEENEKGSLFAFAYKAKEVNTAPPHNRNSPIFPTFFIVFPPEFQYVD